MKNLVRVLALLALASPALAKSPHPPMERVQSPVERPKAAAPKAGKKLGELDLCRLQVLQAADEDAALKQQMLALQKELLDARAALQSAQVAERRKQVLQAAGVQDGERVNLQTGEVTEKGK